MIDERDPLTPEERALAAQVARLGVPDGPSPALDARIRAAAHAAVRTVPMQARRKRWPVAVGVAATLVLAVGVAWRMRPLPGDEVTYSEAPAMPAMRASGPSADDAMAPVQVMGPQAGSGEAVVADEGTPGAVEPPRTDAPKRSARSDADAFPAQAESAMPQEPPIVFDEPSPVDIPAPLPAPPPPPAPPAAAASAPAPAVTMQGAAANAARMRQEQSAKPQESRGSLDTVTVERDAAREAEDASGFSDQAIDDEPPATADSPGVQQAWLQRIRELIADGEREAAKASLAEFKRRHPQVALPQDLREFDRQ